MNPLLPFMKARRELGFIEKFPKSGPESGPESDSDMTVSEALEKAFKKLVKALTPPDTSRSNVVFSVDSFDEPMAELQVAQVDEFIQQIDQYRDKKNVKICHMRHYSTSEAAHWHALFAETDNTGAFIRIIATDSRVDSKRLGITAQKDITKYASFNGLEVGFIAGAQQPVGIKICWLHALANLASLAATGEVYKQQTPNLGIELSGLIEKKKEIQRFFTPSLLEPSETATGSTQTSVETNYQLSWQKAGGSSLLTLAVLLPLSLPANLFILATGIALALLGAVLLLGDSLLKLQEEVLLIKSILVY